MGTGGGRGGRGGAGGDEFEVGKAFDRELLARIWTYVRPYRSLLFVAVGLLILVSACRLALPLIVMRAIDEHLATGDLAGFFQLVGLYGVISIVEFGLRRTQMILVERLGQNTLYDLRLELFAHLQKLSARFFDRTPIGRLVGRVTTDVEALQEMFSSGVVTILADLAFVIAAVAILVSLNWELTLVTMTVVPVLLAITFFIRIRVRGVYSILRSNLSRMNAYLHENVSGMPVVQSFRREDATRDGFREITGEVRRWHLKGVQWESTLSALMELLGHVATALILWYGGRIALGDPVAAVAGLGGGLTLGKVFAFIDLMGRFFQPLTELSQKYTVMQNAMTASSRIFSLLDTEEFIPEPDDPITPPETAGAIRFQNVTFGYDPDEPVLRDVTFRLEPGERVALVGATGSGKTTILKLLTRLYDIQQGEIRLDDVDVRRYALKDLRGRVGVVSQDVFLFEGTICENIRLGHPEVSDDGAISAADRLHLGEMVARFPGGYRERVTERGKNLSSGEKQLIAFARVLASSPSVLALDEATSHVDTHTEHVLQDAVHEIMQGRTSLIVAHRLSTVRDVDRILVMHKGELVEEGSHEELLRQRGVYWRLYQLQFRDQERDPDPALPPA